MWPNEATYQHGPCFNCPGIGPAFQPNTYPTYRALWQNPGFGGNPSVPRTEAFQPYPVVERSCDWRRLSCLHPGTSMGGMADGSVRSMSVSMSPLSLQFLADPFDGNVIPAADLE